MRFVPTVAALHRCGTGKGLPGPAGSSRKFIRSSGIEAVIGEGEVGTMAAVFLTVAVIVFLAGAWAMWQAGA
jgi:hypothetical protein